MTQAFSTSEQFRAQLEKDKETKELLQKEAKEMAGGIGATEKNLEALMQGMRGKREKIKKKKESGDRGSGGPTQALIKVNRISALSTTFIMFPIIHHKVFSRTTLIFETLKIVHSGRQDQHLPPLLGIEKIFIVSTKLAAQNAGHGL